MNEGAAGNPYAILEGGETKRLEPEPGTGAGDSCRGAACLCRAHGPGRAAAGASTRGDSGFAARAADGARTASSTTTAGAPGSEAAAEIGSSATRTAEAQATAQAGEATTRGTVTGRPTRTGEAATDQACSGAGCAAPSQAVPTWQALLLGRLEQYKQYPRLAREHKQQGVATIRFVIDREGNVLSARLDKEFGI